MVILRHIGRIWSKSDQIGIFLLKGKEVNKLVFFLLRGRMCDACSPSQKNLRKRER
jgi:hypothetical protein